MPRFFITFLAAIFLVSFTATTSHAREASTNEVYEALLESKETLIQYQNEKIDLLNNAITWIIAIATIVSTVIIAAVSYIYKRNLRDIERRNAKLKQQEKVLSKVVETEEFQKKLENLQNDINSLQRKQRTFQRDIGNPRDF